MKFRDQLNILLWKNWKIKIRSPVLTVMEIVLPLVLIAILAILRSTVPTDPRPADYGKAIPLPTAGLIPLAQMFCDGGTIDSDHFEGQPGSILDISLTLANWITILADGDWPPREEDSRTDHYENLDFSVFIEETYKKASKGAKPDFQPLWFQNKRKILNTLSREDKLLEKDPIGAAKIYEKIAELQIARQRADEFLMSKGRAAANVNSSVPQECNRFVLPEPVSKKATNKDEGEGGDNVDYWEILTAIWQGLEIAACQSIRQYNSFEEFVAPLEGGTSPGLPSVISIIDIIRRALENNPRILYAPTGTEADQIIQNIYESFQFSEEFDFLTEGWLELSKIIREDLNFTIHGERQDHRFQEWLDEVQDNYDVVTDTVTEDPEVTEIVTEEPERPSTRPPFPTLPPGTIRGWIEASLDGIDYLACSWLSLALDDLDFLDLFEGFSSEEEMVKYFLEGAAEDQVTVIASLAFLVDENGSLPAHVTYKIRQNATISQITSMYQNQIWTPGSDITGLLYIFNGFVWLQDIIERSIIDLKTGKSVTEPGMYIQEFPKPCYIQDSVKLVLVEHMFPLVMVFSNVFTVALLARNIVYEKEHRLKEIMKLMGLEATVHWTAWFITALIQIGITMTLLTILITLTNVLAFTNGFLLWMLFIVFGINTMLFSFFMSTLFNQAKIASACAGIFYLLTYVPYMIISILENGGVPVVLPVKVIFSFFSTTGIGLSGRYFNFFETIGQGVQFDNFMTSLSVSDEYDLFVATMMSIMSSLTYIILIWYIDNVFPGQYGIPRPWYFPFTITYWFGSAAVEDTEEGCHNKLPGWMKRLMVSLGCLSMSRVVEDLLRKTAKTAEKRDSRYFEAEPTDLQVAVQIQNMTKIFSNGKLAVDDLSITMFEGQILSFLGHNGAGKTTTMSMLTGILPPSSGTALIYGKDIRHEMGSIRQNLGMCPQHNVLFESLTVEEHLKFYARLKGTHKHGLELEVEGMLQDTGLREKRFNSIDALSGGMKRKLCIGIAFISGSRTVILDEPTAGVDPWSRREIWDLILKYKEERTIMLSTHHMDEADILGDTIAVISHGSLKCKGSSLFLKSTFGEGYHLVAAKKISPIPGLDQQRGSLVSQFGDDRNRSPSLVSSLGDDRGRSPSVISDISVFENDTVPIVTRCSERNVTLFIQSIVSNAYLKSETARELHYIVPYAAIKSGRASDLFHAFDRSLAGLELESYGVSDTSLEEVFLRVTAYAKSRPSGEALEDMQLGAPPEMLRVPSEEGAQSDVSTPSPFLQRYYSLPNRRTSIDIADEADPMGDLLKFQQMIDKAIANESMESLVVQDSDGHSYTPESFRKEQRSHSETPTPILGAYSRRRKSSFTPVANPQRLLHQRANSADGEMTTSNGELSNHEERNTTDSQTTLNDASESNQVEPSGAAGSYVVSGSRLTFNQFTTCLLKRFYFTVRNWKALVSQIVLPVLFITIAMLIGVIGGPSVRQEVPLELSTAMFFNESKAMADHFVPFSDHGAYDWSYDAPALALMDTFKLPSGIGSTCVIDTPEWNVNGTYEYSDTCQKVLWKDGHKIPPWTLDDYHPLPPENSSAKAMTFCAQFLDGTDEDVKYFPNCQCTQDNRKLVCDDDKNVRDPPEFRVITQDILQNITGVNETSFFYATADQYRTSRFGATTFGHIRSHVPYWITRLPLVLKQMFKKRVAKAWYDSRGWHSVPTFINAINNAILRANLPPERGNPAAYGITAVQHPMNGTTALNAVGSLIFGAEFIIAVMVVVGFSFIPAGFILFLVEERSTKAKHLQFVSGLNPLLYWVSNLLWDMLVYLLPVAVCAGVLQIFRIPAFTEGTNYIATVVLLLVFGWACTPAMYPASFIFKDSSAAYVTLAVINILLGVSLLFVTFLLDYFTEQNQENLSNISERLRQVFMIFPTFALGRGLMDIVFLSTRIEVNELIGIEEELSPFDMDVIGLNLTVMALVGIVFYLLTIFTEYNFFIRPRVMPIEEITPVGKEDKDVALERQRVLKGRAKRDVVRLSNLTKIYNTSKLGKHIAVHRLCLGIPKGECFGMLGVNGAGKTTTFKMLTGDHNPSGGDAFICGTSILKDQNLVRQNMGYCPQFDALFDELTARQHLSLYARLRGIPTKEINRVVEWALEKLELQMYADKSAGTYSGGNKRKLSTAIALLGNPPVIFLDEPTAGMDPYAKRFLWDLILDLIDEGKCIILTSHSMEECETLCGRLAIMVQGRFRCLGSVQHLKSQYGDGYSAKVTVPGPDFESDMRDLILFMNRNFPTATVKERHYNLIEYEFRPEKESLSAVFRGLEKAKLQQLVEDYSISQNTLDNVFINFVKEQQENYETRVGPVTATRKQRPKSSVAIDLEGLSTPFLAQDNECQNNFVSNDLNIDELDELGTEIHLYTHV